MNEVKRRIVCAAIKFPGGEIILGARHWDKRMRETVKALGLKPGLEDQGFIDQFGDYIDRKEAMKIAIEADQIIRTVGGSGKELFSENLY